MRTALLTVAVAVLCAGCTEPEPSSAVPAAPIGVRGTVVRRTGIASSLTVSGETAALKLLRLASPVAGRVTVLSLWPGDSVREGDIAVRVLPLENEAALYGFRVLEDAGVLNEGEQRDGQRLGTELQRNDIALRVPFTAVVADRLHNPGEQVAANDVLLELFDRQSLFVIAQVPVATPVRPGMPVEISLVGSAPVAGHVAALLEAISPQTLTVPVRVALNRPLPRPLLHAAVQCRITTARHPDAIVVPRTALVTTQDVTGGTVVTVAEERTQQRAVRLGLREGDAVEVVDGLVEGEVVLVEGQYAIPDGTRVTVSLVPTE